MRTAAARLVWEKPADIKERRRKLWLYRRVIVYLLQIVKNKGHFIRQSNRGFWIQIASYKFPTKCRFNMPLHSKRFSLLTICFRIFFFEQKAMVEKLNRSECPYIAPGIERLRCHIRVQHQDACFCLCHNFLVSGGQGYGREGKGAQSGILIDRTSFVCFVFNVHVCISIN